MDRKLAKKIRAHLMSREDVERVRFVGGTIHCYGVMPNTDIRGWWFVGYVEDVERCGLHIL